MKMALESSALAVKAPPRAWADALGEPCWKPACDVTATSPSAAARAARQVVLPEAEFFINQKNR